MPLLHFKEISCLVLRYIATPSFTGKEEDVYAFTLLIKRGIQSSLIGNDIQEYTPCRPPWQKKIALCANLEIIISLLLNQQIQYVPTKHTQKEPRNMLTRCTRISCCVKLYTSNDLPFLPSPPPNHMIP